MQKTLKFTSELADLILSGQKTSTWRLFDDKDLITGEEVIFIRRPELVEFATAKLISVIEKTLDQLNDDDKDGHESYCSDDQMYAEFSKIYNLPVDKNSLVKVIKFELINMD